MELAFLQSLPLLRSDLLAASDEQDPKIDLRTHSPRPLVQESEVADRLSRSRLRQRTNTTFLPLRSPLWYPGPVHPRQPGHCQVGCRSRYGLKLPMSLPSAPFLHLLR